MRWATEHQIHRAFEISLILKALHSLLEIMGGLVLAIVNRTSVLHLAQWLTHSELVEDPNDLIANYILHVAQNLSVSAKTAAVIFLLSHGTVKLILVLSVMAGFAWAYPTFMGALGLLIGLQSVQLWHHFSPILMAVTILDLIVLALTWHEYGIVRRQLH
jgi:uncharacterized membrane protein